jgi:hypothetical protein
MAFDESVTRLLSWRSVAMLGNPSNREFSSAFGGVPE